VEFSSPTSAPPRQRQVSFFDNLRIDPASIEALDASLMESISAAYGTGRTGKLAAFLAKCIPEAAQV